MHSHPSRRRFLLQGASALALPAVLPAALYADPNSTLPTPHNLKTPYKYEKLVLAASHKKGAFDEKSVDCPFVFHHEGRYHMTFVGFDGIGYQTGLATSHDLLHWEKYGCILHRNPNDPITRYNVAMMWIMRENGLTSPGNLRKVNGRYLGAWNAYPRPGYEAGPAVIGLCWSDDLRHWHLDPPCLRPDDPDAQPWEQGGLYKACILEHNHTYYMFYNAKTKNLPKSQGGGWHEQIGVAWSKDLKKWHRYPGNPIIRNGPSGSWDDRFASDPCVLHDGRQWAFFYYGLSSDGKARDLLAIGDDLFHPRKTNSVLIAPGPPGTVDSTYSHKPSILTAHGDLYHYYCAVSGAWPHETRGISVARSKPF